MAHVGLGFEVQILEFRVHKKGILWTLGDYSGPCRTEDRSAVFPLPGSEAVPSTKHAASNPSNIPQANTFGKYKHAGSKS